MDVREEFLHFFETKGHSRVEGSPVVPDDATLLFTNAGMVPFKKIFTGEVPAPKNHRATSCQTCVRAGGKHNDLNNVGFTARHHTFFEMLGNFSFGDYFKEDAIAYGWEFITEVLKFPIDKLWVTVHDRDDEAYELWKRWISEDRIVRMGDSDNFWQMGDTGPCGPSSEIFFDQGEESFSGPEDYLGGDGDRFLEIWNLVFMQYERQKKDGKFIDTLLPKPSIDTGMGLERVVALYEGKQSNYDSSLFMPIIAEVEKITTKSYIYKNGASYRVIADHIRTVTFLVAQGVHFSNEGRGYVMRRILRRAVLHGYLLGLKEPFIYRLVLTVVDIMGGHYVYLKDRRSVIEEEIRLEEERFYRTIASGIDLFNEELKKSEKLFSGEVAFKLYDTHGFPLDLTQMMLREKGLGLDSEVFKQLMQEQKRRAKAAWKGSGVASATGDFKAIIQRVGDNKFIGHSRLESEAKIVALLNNEYKQVEHIEAGQTGWFMLDSTPFYAESGGQVGDRGTINSSAVADTRIFEGLNLSLVEARERFSLLDRVEVAVSRDRNEITKHHSATHLLHAALREILGKHVAQAGSLVEANRLRFDFSHSKALNSVELELIEKWVNEKIAANITAVTQEMSVDEAKSRGAMALFGEKYGDSVRVVSFSDSSIELCGGTHVENSSNIGTFLILKESGVSAGVRRIEAVVANAAYRYVLNQRKVLRDVSAEVKNSDAIAGVGRLKEQIRELKHELVVAQSIVKKEFLTLEISGVKLIVDEMEGGDIKSRIDEIKNENSRVAVMLFQIKGDRVLLAAGVKDALLKAGDWIKAIAPVVGGGGGGRADFAQAGGKEISGIKKAKKSAIDFAKEILS